MREFKDQVNQYNRLNAKFKKTPLFLLPKQNNELDSEDLDFMNKRLQWMPSISRRIVLAECNHKNIFGDSMRKKTTYNTTNGCNE